MLTLCTKMYINIKHMLDKTARWRRPYIISWRVISHIVGREELNLGGDLHFGAKFDIHIIGEGPLGGVKVLCGSNLEVASNF